MQFLGNNNNKKPNLPGTLINFTLAKKTDEIMFSVP